MTEDFLDKVMRVQREGYEIKIPKDRLKKAMARGWSPDDTSTWTAKCAECGAKMVYIDSEHDPRYLCRKCGNVLEV